MASMVPKNSPPASHDDGGDGGGAALPVTSCLYLHRPEPDTGALDKDAVLRRIRHLRQTNRLRESLQSLLLSQQAAAPAPETAEKDGERLAWLDDAFSLP